MTALDFASCLDVTDEEIEAAFAPVKNLADTPPRERVAALLDRMAEVAQPGEGAGRILDVLGRMASSSWVEGELSVVVRGFGPFSEVDVLTYDGLSYTRILQPLAVSVPLAEFVEWVAKRGGCLGPLELAHDEPGVELQLHTFEPPPESIRMSRPPDEEGVDAVLNAEGAAAAIHRKQTLKLSAVRVPKEAYRPDGPPPPASPTQKVPAVRPAVEPSPKRDDIDKGWEWKSENAARWVPSRRACRSEDPLLGSGFFGLYRLLGGLLGLFAFRGRLLGGASLDQLHDGHRRVVAAAVAQLDDARVATRTT